MRLVTLERIHICSAANNEVIDRMDSVFNETEGGPSTESFRINGSTSSAEESEIRFIP